MQGRKPDSLYRVKNAEIRQFVEKCLTNVSSRPSAKELLEDPFLRLDDHWPSDISLSENDVKQSEEEYDDEQLMKDVEISINGRRSEDGDDVYLRLKITDNEGRVRNIYFHFDVESDTALSVATEMVAELDMTHQDVAKIADMIDEAVASLVPEWEKGLLSTLNENGNDGYCSKKNNVQVLECSQDGCAAVHGRFEEIMYQFEGSGVPGTSSQWDGVEEEEEKERMDDDHDHDRDQIGQELRWLKAKYEWQLREPKHHDQKVFPIYETGSCSPEMMGGTAKSFYAGGLHKPATPLTIDAIQF